MDSEKRTDILHDLDLKYRHTIHECDLVVKEEDARRLKLRSMVLRDETSGLKDQLAQKDIRVKELVDQIDDVRRQLDSMHEKGRRQDQLMQSQAREITNLKEELSAFNAVSHDSAKILSEKLALSREVALLKPELEHLRSQLAHQKDVLAEKLALERQLNTLEVELANERRVAQKVAQKHEHEDQAEEELRKQVCELEKELAKEKRLNEKNMKNHQNENNEVEGELETLREQLAAVEKNLATEKRRADQLAKTQINTTSEMEEELEQLRQALAEAEKALVAERKTQEKLRKENEQAQVDAEERQQAMGDKVDRLRSKFREAQEELKKCRLELEKAQERAGAGAKANAKKKRAADEMSMDDKVLLTPGNMDERPKRPLKKRGFDLSMVGGKSEFSITPFLNKTVNVDGSPKPSGDDTTPTAAVQFRGAEEATTAVTAEPTTEDPAAAAIMSSASKPTPAKLVEKRPRGRPRTKPLTDSSPATKNLTARNRKAPRIESTLENVAEEADEGDSSTNQDQENRSTGNTDSTSVAKTTATTTTADTNANTATISLPEKAEPKKKKRKLLGANPSTIFEEGEDEGERVKPAAGAAAAAATSAATAATTTAIKRPGVKSMGKGPVAGRLGPGVKNAFAGTTFSPLKRERRGVAASWGNSFRVGLETFALMQASWTRTPFRLAVPVSGLSSCLRSCATTTSSNSFSLAPLRATTPRISPPSPRTTTPSPCRPSSSSASSRWKLRQGSDPFARSARVQGLKSRAAFKLLELDAKYHLFRRGKGQVVVDLGFAPGSWSQVALDRTAPDGRVVGIDIIPAQPPRGVSTIQGNFLSPGVQGMVKQFLVEGEKKKKAEKAAARMEKKKGYPEEEEEDVVVATAAIKKADEGGGGDEVADRPSYIDLERMAAHESDAESGISSTTTPPDPSNPKEVVLSDMSAPWPQTHGFSVNSLSNPYIRMMNTSGIAFKDHVGSMDLCRAALSFASETLKPGGHFVCKFYQGAEDKALEMLLKKMFAKVHREKPESSRSESKENFFVALRRKGEVTLGDIEV
ncbi:hypothetical protein C8A00DRAFT_44770 [Chaetomidium leptoderma]|uniref:rRNA methyltransferase 2, mitochondrial n=1 Tax=Chaetomidium leptoderma TaxID=669021 RepID=A0AAN6VJS1_9PEZI|nr:hypothetical protein C8A00DRAFT_44770 [Chaetomidium leptoderma]